MQKPDLVVLRALHALKHTEEFKRVFEWLQKSLAAERKALEDSVVDQATHRAQGSASTLRTIIDTIEGTQAALDRAANTRP